MVSKDSEGKLTCQPIFSRIVSLFAEQNDLMYAVPGGLIGVGTKVDPTLCRADRSVNPLSFFWQYNALGRILFDVGDENGSIIRRYHKLVGELVLSSPRHLRISIYVGPHR